MVAVIRLADWTAHMVFGWMAATTVTTTVSSSALSATEMLGYSIVELAAYDT